MKTSKAPERDIARKREDGRLGYNAHMQTCSRTLAKRMWTQSWEEEFNELWPYEERLRAAWTNINIAINQNISV